MEWRGSRVSTAYWHGRNGLTGKTKISSQIGNQHNTHTHTKKRGEDACDDAPVTRRVMSPPAISFPQKAPQGPTRCCDSKAIVVSAQMTADTQCQNITTRMSDGSLVSSFITFQLVCTKYITATLARHATRPPGCRVGLRRRKDEMQSLQRSQITALNISTRL